MAVTVKSPTIAVGDQVFVAGDEEEFGAVREVRPAGRPEIVVYVENAGDFFVPIDAVESAHDEKVVLRRDRLEPSLKEAIAHAHDAEDPDL
jgi:hypothetical protein